MPSASDLRLIPKCPLCALATWQLCKIKQLMLSVNGLCEDGGGMLVLPGLLSASSPQPTSVEKLPCAQVLS